MAQYTIVDAVSVTPQVAAATATVHIAAVRVDQVIIGGPCPHMTALMDSSNQPIRESATGLVILVETH